MFSQCMNIALLIVGFYRLKIYEKMRSSMPAYAQVNMCAFVVIFPLFHKDIYVYCIDVAYRTTGIIVMLYCGRESACVDGFKNTPLLILRSTCQKW